MRGCRPAAAQRQPAPRPSPWDPQAQPQMATPIIRPRRDRSRPELRPRGAQRGYQGMVWIRSSRLLPAVSGPGASPRLSAKLYLPSAGTTDLCYRRQGPVLPQSRVVSLDPRGVDRNPESQAAGALGDTRAEPSLEQVLQERDEAIAKKRAVEAELQSCRARLRTVEAQLLEVLQEKLRLKQEVEAWEEDMQLVVQERVQSQLQEESRGALGTQENASAGRGSRIHLSWSQWGRWW
ncbi:uncharacterized protein LOC118572647 [Onychomys torridus]|uniref:uncharacterized protein LOC118572647 n=1 Tax=Onychomys torridus TaxID=38674 RepID=UPI00167F1F17|nr:uncharacterized protein LOC118572647 [Onychomys torridus]